MLILQQVHFRRNVAVIASHRLLSTFGSLVVVLGAAVGATGCEVGYYQEPVYAEADAPVIWVEGPPVVDYDAYPVCVYGGTNVYFIDGRWYYRDHDERWAYYRNEPDDLGRWRAHENIAVNGSYHGRSGSSQDRQASVPNSQPISQPAPAPGSHPMNMGSEAPPNHAPANVMHPPPPVASPARRPVPQRTLRRPRPTN